MRIKNTVARGSRYTIRTKAIIVATAGLLAVGAATAAYATVVEVEGGTWSYGVTGTPLDGWNYSDYYHDFRWHGSSVSNSNGLRRSPCTADGYWSHAYQTRSITGNKAYYRFCLP